MEIMGAPEQSRAAKPMTVMLLLLIISQRVSATNHTIGGPSGWNVDSDMKNWQSKAVFLIGDNLVFVYKHDQIVIEVSERDYAACETGSPIHTYSGGNTVVPLAKRGTRYFVSGKPSLCFHGLKIQIYVLLPHEKLSSSPSNEIGSGAAAPIGSDDQVKSPDATANLCHRRSPPLSPRRYPPPPRSQGFRPPMSPSYEDPPTQFPPTEFPSPSPIRAFLVEYWYVVVIVLGLFGGSMLFCLFRVQFMCMCESCGGCITSQNPS